MERTLCSDHYIYGERPNLFFAQELVKYSAGKILLPMEGEGRNAVFAASQQWKVLAFDFSEVARSKALKLAEMEGFKIDYLLVENESFFWKLDYFDAIALIYTHLPSAFRRSFYQSLITYLKPGGVITLEVFSKDHLAIGTSGPRNLDLLNSIDEL